MVPLNGVRYQQYLHFRWALCGIHVSPDTMALAGITRSSVRSTVQTIYLLGSECILSPEDARRRCNSGVPSAVWNFLLTLSSSSPGGGNPGENRRFGSMLPLISFRPSC